MTDVERWALLPFHRGPSAFHFALSDVLVRQVRRPTIWWHAADQPTIILGAGQKWVTPTGLLEGRGSVQTVRRRAGGTAVYASEGVLGLDVALPAGHRLSLPDVVEAYRWLGEVWVRAMRMLGIPTHLVSIAEARSRAREAGPYEELVRLACFGSLSPYEVAVGNRKLVGLAQVRRRSGILLQAGVHRHFDAGGLAAVLAPGDPSPVADALRRAALGLDETAVSDFDEKELMAVFHTVLQEIQNVRLEPAEWTEGEWRQAEEQAAGDAE